MKKTFITLLALAGVAMGGITDDQLSYIGWDAPTEDAKDGTIVSTGGADNGGYLDGTEEGISFYTNDGYQAPSNSFTLAFKVRNVENFEGTSTLASIAPYTTESTWLQVSIRANNEGALTLVYTPNDETATTILTLDSTTVNASTLEGDEWVSIILSGSSSGLTLNVNGVAATTTGYTLGSQNTVDFQLGGTKFRGGSSAKAEYDDVAFWNRNLTSDEIDWLAAGNLANGNAKYVAPSGNIPEPTTATLSLLALAGLAARRRRK